MMALYVARQIGELVAALVKLEPLLEGVRFAASCAVDHHHAISLVLLDHLRDERSDHDRQRHDDERQPEASHAGDLAELAGGDEEDVVVHWAVSGAPTMCTNTS